MIIFYRIGFYHHKNNRQSWNRVRNTISENAVFFFISVKLTQQ